MRRYLDPEYEDLAGAPRQSAKLPLSRVVSTRFHPDQDIPSQEVTHMVTQWGQFLDHDITLTPENEVHDCCGDPTQAECFVLSLPSDDPFYSTLSTRRSCLEFSRSAAFCEEAIPVREQINGITAFVDASNVYGSDEETSNLLRSFVDGKLRANNSFEKELLPTMEGMMQVSAVR